MNKHWYIGKNGMAFVSIVDNCYLVEWACNTRSQLFVHLCEAVEFVECITNKKDGAK